MAAELPATNRADILIGRENALIAQYQDWLMERHRPELIETSGMVYEIWQDGEITLTKARSLYRQRGLHQIRPNPRLFVRASMALVPEGSSMNSRVVVTAEDAKVFQKSLWGF